jgi:hypothetical protein
MNAFWNKELGDVETAPAQFMLLVMCDDEKQQLALLQRFKGEGLAVKALVS